MDPVRDAELYRGLEETLGPRVASALMDRLPPEPVDQLTTKADLASECEAAPQRSSAAESARCQQEMVAMKHELIATMRGEMIGAIHTQGRQLAFTLAGSLVGLSGLAWVFGNLAS